MSHECAISFDKYVDKKVIIKMLGSRESLFFLMRSLLSQRHCDRL